MTQGERDTRVRWDMHSFSQENESLVGQYYIEEMFQVKYVNLAYLHYHCQPKLPFFFE